MRLLEQISPENVYRLSKIRKTYSDQKKFHQYIDHNITRNIKVNLKLAILPKIMFDFYHFLLYNEHN